ncbi:hypothetical protein ACQYAD_15730 [Neobacillus sp. SM06]|uniref:hypothetical protein n=1 Tax=Neobacillus sp. SM06 TaxID=3422492 RepID=UPI003D2978E0
MVLAVWVFSSILLVGVMVTVLPLGLSKSGKAIATFSSLLLAMAGLAAAVSFPLWFTFVLLLLLAFLTASLLDSRWHRFIYKKSSQFTVPDFYVADQDSLAAENKELNVPEQPPVLANISPGFMEPASVVPDIEEDLVRMLSRNQDAGEEETFKMSELETDYLSDIEELLAARVENGIDSVDMEQSSTALEQESEIPLVTVDSSGGK